MKLESRSRDRVPELADALGVGDVGHLDADHEQRHRDREQAVAEGEDAGELDALAVVAAPAVVRHQIPRSRMTPGFREPSQVNPIAGRSWGFARMPTWLPSGTLPSKLLPSSIAASSLGAPTSRYLKRRRTGWPSFSRRSASRRVSRHLGQVDHDLPGIVAGLALGLAHALPGGLLGGDLGLALGKRLVRRAATARRPGASAPAAPGPPARPPPSARGRRARPRGRSPRARRRGTGFGPSRVTITAPPRRLRASSSRSSDRSRSPSECPCSSSSRATSTRHSSRSPLSLGSAIGPEP